MRRVFVGSESPDVLSIPINADGSLAVADVVRVPASANPLGLKHGNPDGVNVEWLITHPNASWLYAFVSYWDHAVAEVVTFAIDESAAGCLKEVNRQPTLGYQAAHAELLYTSQSCRTLGVCHYHSGSITLFDVGQSGGPPTLVSTLALPGLGGVARPLHDGRSPFTAPEFGSGVIEPHAHGLALAPATASLPKGERWLLVADAGLGVVLSVRVAPRRGGLLSFGGDGAYEIVGEPVSSPIAPPEQPFGGVSSAALVSKAAHRPRHLAFAAAETLLVLHEFANAVSVHSFDGATGAVAPRTSIVSAIPTGAKPLLGRLAALLIRPLSMRLVLPLFALSTGIGAAAEIAVHARSGNVVVSNRGYFTKSSVRVFAPVRGDANVPTALTPVQDVLCGGNPRHLLFISGLGSGEVLLVGVTGGVDVFSVSDEGLLSPQATARFTGESLAKLEVCAVGVA